MRSVSGLKSAEGARGGPLGPQSAISEDFRRQTETDDTGLSLTQNPGKQADSACFPGSDEVVSEKRDTGVEPVSQPAEVERRQGVTASPSKPLAQTLARDSQIDPALVLIVEAWPKLPEAIRKAMLALAEIGH
jgi:hypothetical protein